MGSAEHSYRTAPPIQPPVKGVAITAPLLSSQRWLCLALATAERLQDLDLIRRGQPRSQPMHLCAIDKDAHMLADRVLLVDHPEADSWETAIEVRQHLRYRRAVGVNLVRMAGVRTERCRDTDLHYATSAASSA